MVNHSIKLDQNNVLTLEVGTLFALVKVNNQTIGKTMLSGNHILYSDSNSFLVLKQMFPKIDITEKLRELADYSI